MKIKWKVLLICLGIPLAAGGLGAALGGGMGIYTDLNQPPLSPPGWVFPIVWTALYLLMGYASYRIYTSDAAQKDKRRALVFYGIQLLLNFLWPAVFFGLQWYWAAFLLLLSLWVMVYITMFLFGIIDDSAENLLIPYLLWLTFAGYLTAMVWLLN